MSVNEMMNICVGLNNLMRYIVYYYPETLNDAAYLTLRENQLMLSYILGFLATEVE